MLKYLSVKGVRQFVAQEKILLITGNYTQCMREGKIFYR